MLYLNLKISAIIFILAGLSDRSGNRPKLAKATELFGWVLYCVALLLSLRNG